MKWAKSPRHTSDRAILKSGGRLLNDVNVARLIAPLHLTLSLPCGEQKSTIGRVNYWNIIADTLGSLNKARL